MKVELYRNLIIDNVNLNKEIPFYSSKVEKATETSEKTSPPKREEKLKELAKELKEFLKSFNLEAKLVYNRDFQTLVVQVFRIDTGELIKQIPPEELLEVSKRIQELVGILLRDKA